VIGLIPVALAFKTALGGACRARTKSLGWLPLALIVPLTLAGATGNPSSSPIFWLAMAYALAGGDRDEKFHNPGDNA